MHPAASAKEGPRALKHPGTNSQIKNGFTTMENLSLRYPAEEQIDYIISSCGQKIKSLPTNA
jgi:hypothetical protein